MAKTPETAAADAIIKAFDSIGLNNRLTASFVIDGMVPEQQNKFFDFIIHVIDIFAGDTMEGFVGMDRATRNMVCLAIIEAIKNEGYSVM